MSEDRSLDEFVGADEDDAATAEELEDETVESDVDDEERGESDGNTDVRDPEEVEPATATFDWSPNGSECTRCGSIVDRRWVDDDEYVCANCKEW